MVLLVDTAVYQVAGYLVSGTWYVPGRAAVPAMARADTAGKVIEVLVLIVSPVRGLASINSTNTPEL